MARKPDKVCILAGDAYSADVRVANLNVEVTRTGNGVSVCIRDSEFTSRSKVRVHMAYMEHPSFKINDDDIGKWMRWMEETQNFKTLDNLLAYLKYHDSLPNPFDEPVEPRKVTHDEGGPLPRSVGSKAAAKVIALNALKRAEQKAPPGRPEPPGDRKVYFPITAYDFERCTGREPEFDDLERCNCKKAGDVGHAACGMCRHGLPIFLCEHCFSHSIEVLKGRQVHP